MVAGQVFPDRYHGHILKTPAELRNALAYVLKNFEKHTRRRSLILDRFASGLVSSFEETSDYQRTSQESKERRARLRRE